MPVVSAGRLIGVVTSDDFLREYSYGDLPGSRDAVASHLPPRHETLDPDTTLDAALLAMQESGHSHMAVVHGGCPVGIASQSDIIRARCEERRPDRRQRHDEPDRPGNTVASVMLRTPPFRPGQRLCEAAAAMVEHQLSAIVVTNQANRFLGILTDTDLLELMLKQLK